MMKTAEAVSAGLGPVIPAGIDTVIVFKSKWQAELSLD